MLISSISFFFDCKPLFSSSSSACKASHLNLREIHSLQQLPYVVFGLPDWLVITPSSRLISDYPILSINIFRTSVTYVGAPSLSSHNQSLQIRNGQLLKRRHGFFAAHEIFTFILPPHLHFGISSESAHSKIAATTLLSTI